MKNTLVALFKGTFRLVKTIYLFIAALLRALIGTWQPPVWAGWITKKITAVLCRYPRLIAGLSVLGIATFFGHQQWQKWWLLHQPQPRELIAQRKLTLTLEAPGLSVWHQEKLVPSPMILRFSENAAPLEAIGKPIEQGISLQPAVAGSWKWSDAKTIIFTPSAEYLAGTAYTITWAKSLLPEEILLDQDKLTFTSFEQKASILDYIFYTQPDRPEIHQLTATLRSTYPATQEQMRAAVNFTAMKIDDVSVPMAAPAFTLTAAKDPFTWYFRTEAVKIPELSQPMKLAIKAGLPAIVGGVPSTQEVVAKATIPDKYSALFVRSLNPLMVKNSQGEPKQMMSLTTSIPVKSEELSTRLKLYRLSPGDDDQLKLQQSTAAAVTPEMIARATPVKWERVIEDDDAPFTTQHTVQFFSPVPGRMFVSVDAKLPGLGGFEMRESYQDFAYVPLYPIELEWTGKGNILALEGERKIQFKSRGVDYIKVTLGRVRAGELNHLITQNDYGDFSDPSLDGGFSKDSLVRSQYFIIKVDKKNDWDACYTGFDLSAALAKADPSDPDPSRGVFFVSATSVRPTLHTPEPETVLSHVESGEDYFDYEYDDTRNSESGEPPHVLIDHTGRSASLLDWFEKFGEKDSLTWGEGQLAKKRFVMLTDLGTLIKTNADGSRDVFVMSIKNQVPIPASRVRIIARNGEVLQEMLTDENGRANLAKIKVTARESQAVACTVSLGQDTSFIPLRAGQLPSMDYSRYSVDGVMSSRTQAVEAHVFTERGVYRPGDDIHFAAVVRRRDWQAVIEGLPIRAILCDSDGVNVAEQQMKLPRDGFFEGKMKTAETHPTGLYELKLYVLNAKETAIEFLLGRTAVRVEDFRPDRMKMKVEMQPALAKGWIKPSELKARVTLTNLFGIVAAERKVKGVIELSATDFSFADWPEYQFSTGALREDEDSSSGKTIELGEVETDAAGIAEIALPLAGVGKANLRAQLNLEAFESDGGHGVRDSQSFMLSPWDYVVGFKPDVSLDYVGKDSSASVKWIALSPDAQALAVSGLTFRLSQRKVISVLRKQENGSMVYQSESREVIVRDETGKSLSTSPNTIALDTSMAGDFILSVMNEAGEILCRCSYSVIGKGNQQRNLDRDAELMVKPSKSRVNAGDVVELSIVAPYKGAGLITLEREKVLYSQWFQADTNATVQSIRIPEGMDGTVYCNVSFVRSLESADIMMSPLSYAAVPITIAPTQHEMSMEIDAPQVVKPGDTLNIGYRTTEPSRVIIYAVDEGIHQITRYQRPQPLDFFFRKQALEVRTQQWFDLLMPEYRFLHQNAAFGGDGDGGLEALSLQLNPFKRKRDAPVVYWAGIVAADATRKELSWVVPDYFSGSLNIMAVAVNEEKISGAETKTLVRSPLILTVNAPVHAAPGDEFVASLTVANNKEQDGAAEVEVTLQPSANLQVIGESVAKISVEKQREVTCRFRVKALAGLGNADLVFLASSGEDRSRRTETISVRPSGPFRSAVRSSYVRTKSNDEAITRDLFDVYRRGEVSASPLPVVLAGGLVQYMNAYPHGCTEQITSKAMTLLATRTIKGLKLGLSEDEVQQRLSNTLSQLQRRQAANGGFGYWDSSSGEVFLSCYVSHFLLECKEAGLAVPASMHQRANGYLSTLANGAEPRNLESADQQAYAIYLLLRQGQKTNGLAALRETLDRVFKDQWQDRLCGSLMASSYLLLQKKSEADAISKRWQKGKAVVYQNGVYYWNRAEVDQLLSFSLRARHFSDVVKNYGYAEWKELYGVLWEQRFNTLTASYAALGMREFSQLTAQAKFGYEIFAQAKGSKDFVSLVKSTDTLVHADFSRDTQALRFVLDQGDSDLGLFYQVVEEGFDQVEPTSAVRDGIEVFRELVRADGSKVDAMKVGETVTMKLRIRNVSPDALSYLALVDLLPSGFVIEPGAMQPGRGTVAGTDRADLREDRNLFYLSLPKAGDVSISYPIRAVCAGDFVVPALFAESMYDRGINGLGLSQRVKVEANE